MDRGVVNEEDVMDTDPLHAALIKKKLKTINKEAAKEQKRVKFAEENGSDEEYESDEEEEANENSYSDSDDGEMEDEGEEEHEEIKNEMAYIDKKKAQNKLRNQKKEEEDANLAAKQAQIYKAAEGVKFTEYDQYGLPKNDGFDYHQYISTDERPADMVIAAPPEMILQMMKRGVGRRTDVDKELFQMNEEGTSNILLTLNIIREGCVQLHGG